MNNNRIYIALALILICLSLGGLIYLNRPATKSTLLTEYTATPTPAPVSDDYPTISDTPSISETPPAEPSTYYPEPTSAILEPTPTPTISTLVSDTYGFSVPYSSSRKLYDTPENGGTRFTLYSPSGNITVHAGSRWSWLHPGREFSSDLLVSGQPSFVYKISTQTLIDFEYSDRRFTIQCVHGGQASLKSECDQFISEFKLSAGS